MSVPRFWREIPQRYNLQASRCTVCEAVHYPPRAICPACRRDSVGKMERVKLSGRGRVTEWTRVHRAAPGHELLVPYVMALIQTEEGPPVLGQLADLDGDPAPGQAVHAVFRRIAADGDAGVIHYGVKWAPDRAAGAAVGEGATSNEGAEEE